MPVVCASAILQITPTLTTPNPATTHIIRHLKSHPDIYWLWAISEVTFFTDQWPNMYVKVFYRPYTESSTFTNYSPNLFDFSPNDANDLKLYNGFAKEKLSSFISFETIIAYDFHYNLGQI